MTVVPAPLGTLAAEASLIVRGEVLWTRVEPQAKRPWASRTRATVAVWRTYKHPATAPAPDLVDVLLPGGSRAGLTTRVPGVPTLHQGDRVLLLLQPVPGGYAPLGYGLGVLSLTPASAPPTLVDLGADTAVLAALAAPPQVSP